MILELSRFFVAIKRVCSRLFTAYRGHIVGRHRLFDSPRRPEAADRIGRRPWREMVPRTNRIATLLNMSIPAEPPQWEETKAAARTLAIEPQLLDVRKPEDLGRAFETAIRQRADALVVGINVLTQANRRPIADLATKHRLPAIYASREFVDAGGLGGSWGELP